MSNYFRGVIRASSFFRKEIFEVLRQPRLITTLVLGPFLILLIFGIGYRNESRTLRTLFVTQTENSIIADDMANFADTKGLPFEYSGVTNNSLEALDALTRREVDLVVIEPEDPVTTIKNDEQAVFTFYHREIDPNQVSYVDYLGWLYVTEVNREVLRSFIVQGQEETTDLHTDLQEARQNVTAMRQALQSGDEALAQQEQQGLSTNLNAISLAVGASLGLLDSLQPTSDSTQTNTEVQSTLSNLQQNTDMLGSSTNDEERITRLDEIEGDISSLETQLAEFQALNPTIIVSPFRSETKSMANVQPSITDFFAPAVLALLLQHLAVTFAALSIVRERNAGTMELFRVSPLSGAEALFGKYISYMLFGGLIATILSVLLVYVLNMPMLGDWRYFALVIAALLFTSLGIGFIISIISQTDSQAVQYSMITLLASVFFSGFIMTLDMLWEPVRVVSWMLPNTYGTILLRDIALSGIAPNWMLLIYLSLIGLVLMVLSWMLMVRLIASSK